MLPDDGLLEELLAILDRPGCRDAEIFVQRSDFVSIVRAGGKTGEAGIWTLTGAGFRVRRGETVFFSSVSGLEPRLLKETAMDLFRGAVSWRPSVSAPTPRRHDGIGQGGADHPPAADLERAGILLEAGEAGALGVSPRILEYRGRFLEEASETAVIDSSGFLARQSKRTATLFQRVSVEGKKDAVTAHRVQDAAEGVLQGAEGAKLQALDAAACALRRVDALPIPSGSYPVIFGPRAAGVLLHRAVARTLEGDFVASGDSPYGGKVGDRVAPARVTLVDDGTLPGGRGTARYDDEGTVAGRTVLVEEGILRDYLLDRSSASLLGLHPNGHARRESYRRVPSPRVRNLCLEPGSASREELAGSVDFGLFVLRLGRGEVDLSTGAFSFAVEEGYLIRDGRVSEPVGEGLVEGDGPRLLTTLVGLGDDVECSVAGCVKNDQLVWISVAAPSVKVESLSVRGGGPC